ncbi:MAG TPA: hypothetical protein VFP53_05440 [Sphingomicrobium sp.]|nr:hypothetical protein [Sphingomicrobium sp.]
MNALLFASAVALAAAAPTPEHSHHAPKLGSLTFDTTCTAEGDVLFEQGLGWLHSFEYEQSARIFAQAAAADPRCAIAEWGIAMSNYHPLWAPPTAAEVDTARKAIARAQAIGAGSQREKDYVAAIDTFFRDSERRDHKTRTLEYTSAMKELSKRYPDDREAAVFYALALIAAGTMDNDPEFAKERRAGAILNEVLQANGDHPGVAHYLIHSFDYPALADLALPAARRYASLAPDSPHAQHMPSHIFVRLGLWDEAIKSNLASEAAARNYATAHGLADSSSERLHAMDYLAYCYLQTGRDADAEQVLANLNAIQRADPPVFSVAYAATAIPARLLLERRMWKQAASLGLKDNVRNLAPLENYQWGEAHVHFARAVGASRSGDGAAARDEVGKLKAIEQALVVPAGTYDWRRQVNIERRIAEGWLALAEGREADAEQILRDAATLDDSTEKHPVTPGAILPAREQLAELLIELGRPTEAIAEYQASLTRAPKRLAALYGTARAARLAGDDATARRYFLELAEVTRDGSADRAEIRDARAAAAQTARR